MFNNQSFVVWKKLLYYSNTTSHVVRNLTASTVIFVIGGDIHL